MTVRGESLLRRAMVPAVLALILLPLVASATQPCPRVKHVGLSKKLVEVAWTMGIDERNVPDFGGYRVWMRDAWRVDEFELAHEYVWGEDDTSAAGYWPFAPFYEDSLRVFSARSVQNAFPYEFSVTAFTRSAPDSTDQGCLSANRTGIVYPNNGPQDNLKKIQPIPNPYRSSADWEYGGQKRVVFVGLPAKATINIYTTALEHVRTLRHDDPGTDLESWDLKTSDGEEVAPGVYIWHVDAGDLGTIDGKMMIIK
jgi:hypothetical protein